MYEILLAKFELGFVREDQLLRYLNVGYLTEAEYTAILTGEPLETEEI